MPSVECSIVCSTYMDVEADRQKKVISLWNVDMEKNGKDSWLDKVTNEEALRRVNEDRQILNSMWQRKHWWIGHVLRHDELLHELKAEWKVNQQEGEEEFKCYTIWQMMVALLHSNGSWGQRGMETQRKDVKNLLYSRRLLMMRWNCMNIGKGIFVWWWAQKN